MKDFEHDKSEKDSLTHYGVRGMRWGIRKDVSSEVSKIGNTMSDVSSKVSASNKTNKKAKGLSDEELRKEINRLDLERRYSELNPSTVSKGASRAADTLSVIGKLAAVAASVATIAVAVNKYRSDNAPISSTTRSMSDADLASNIKRMNLERSYEQLIRRRV